LKKKLKNQKKIKILLFKKNSSIEVISRFGPKSITVDLHLTEREKKRDI